MPEPLTGEPFILVTPEGGDGQRLLRLVFDAAEAGATVGLRSVVVTGPLPSAGRRAGVMMRAADNPTRVAEFVATCRHSGRSPPISAPTTATTAATSVSSSSVAAAASQTLTFNLVGGSTAIAFSEAGAEVLWATAEPGFEARIEPGSSETKVEFRADHHRSRIDAWWSGGPRHEIRERPG